MKYQFDTVIDRRGTSSVKWDRMEALWGRTDILPLWVADMDFATAPFVLEAIKERCNHPVLGYTDKSDNYYQSIVGWVKARYGMEITREMLNYVPGVVAGLGMAIHCFTSPGDKILIQTPVYPPFSWLVTRNKRTLVTGSLIQENNTFRMDLKDFSEKIKGVKVFILCNPHNPGGIVWDKETLQEIARICAENKVLVFSDEIHADLTLPPCRHLPFAMVSDEAKMNSVTFMSPSKAFNMPGLAASHAIIFNESLRKQFADYLSSGELDGGHLFAFTGVEAAYSHGTEWLETCLSYIQSNIDFVLGFLEKHTPKIKAMRPHASYLLWLDCRELGLSQPELNRFFVDKARLGLNDGETFGKEGVGFMRMNVAAPRVILEQAMKQLEEAYKNL